MNHRIISAVLSFSMILTAVAGCSEANTTISISDTFSVAEHYLSEMKYEQAIIEFDKILSVEPKNVDAYLGKAEAYIALGEVDNAVKTLQTGFEQTGDERIKTKLDELVIAGASDSDTGAGSESVDSAQDITADETEITADNSAGNNTSESVIIAGNTYTTDQKYLYINNTKLTNDDINKISLLTELDSVAFSDCDLSDVTDISSMSKLNKLRRLSIVNYTTENGNIGFHDLSALSGLDELRIRYNNNIDYGSAGNIASLIIYLDAEYVDKTTIDHIYSFDNVTGIDVSGDISNDQLALLSTKKNLKSLSLGYQTNITDISPVFSLTELEELTADIRYDGVIDGSPIGEMKHLKRLIMKSVHFKNKAFLRNLPELTDLGIDCCSYPDSDIDLEVISELIGLDYLDISIGNLPQSYDTIDEDPLAGLSNLSNLTDLSVAVAAGDLRTIDFLSGMPKLTNLYIWRNNSDPLDLTVLLKLKNLLSCNLNNVDITDSEMSVLTQMKQLYSLGIKYSQISDSDKEKLKQALPNCQISIN